MKKSYLIYSALYFPSTYGVERYTYNIAKRLVEKGNEVTIVTCNVFRLDYYENVDGIEIYRVPCINLLKGRYPINKLNRLSKKINKKLEEKRYDLVIVNTRFYLNSLIGMRFAKRNKSKCITIEHGSCHLSMNNKILDFIANKYEHFITYIGKKYCHDYYGVSNECALWLKHFNIEAKGCLFNSIDLNEIKSIEKLFNEDIRKKYSISREDIIILFVGRLIVEKGVLELIKAVNEVNKNNNIYLFIAGSGELEKQVSKMTNRNIIFLNNIEHKEVLNLMRQSNIFCLPSIAAEGMPTVVLEAIASKCFVITSNKGGSKEIIQDRSYGSILNDNSWRGIYKELINVINQRDYMLEAANNSYKELEKKYCWDNVIDKIENIN